MNYLRILVFGFLFLVACGTPIQPVQPNVLGTLEVSFAGNNSKAVFKASSNRSLTVNSASALEFMVADFVTFDQNLPIPKQRTLTQIIQITNNGATAFQNLSFVAYAKTGNNAFSALKEISTFVGTPSNSDVYGVLPAHGSGGAVLLAPFRSDLQLYTTEEASVLTADARATNIITSSEYALEYGFVARRNGSSHARGLGASGCSGVGCNQGQVALAMRLPASADVSSGRRFVMTFIVAENTQSHVVQSLEEDLAGTDALARASSVVSGTQVRAFRNSKITQIDPKKYVTIHSGFEARIAGDLSNPLAYLRVNPLSVDRTFLQNFLDGANSEIDWILRRAFASGTGYPNLDGAVRMYGDSIEPFPKVGDSRTGYIIEPYFANLAMLAVLETRGLSTNSVLQNEVFDKVESWLKWFLQHINLSFVGCTPNTEDCNNIPGSINKLFYDIANNELVKLPMDSVDSYSSTFLVLLTKFHGLSGRTQIFSDYRNEIKLIRDTILYETISSANYKGTWVAANQRTVNKFSCFSNLGVSVTCLEYFMDNIEVWEAFVQLGVLAAVPNLLETNSTQAQELKVLVETRILEIRQGLENFFSPTLNLYKSSNENKDKDVPPVNIMQFYPDATAQLFPIISGYLPNPKSDTRAKFLWSAFNKAFGNWRNNDKPDGFPWALMAYAAALMGDYWQVESYLTVMQTKFINSPAKRSYPYHVGEAGWIVRAANHVLKTP